MFRKSIELKSDSLACSDRGNKVSASNSNSNEHSLSMRTMVRRDADLEDQLIHDAASEKLPMY
jgi:hypothetical protein